MCSKGRAAVCVALLLAQTAADGATDTDYLATLIAKVESGEINAASGKKVFARMFETGKPAAEIIAAEGFSQVSDTGEIERWCREVIEKNPDNLAKYRAGNEGVFKFFVGQVMRASRGQANPQTVNDTLKRLLS